MNELELKSVWKTYDQKLNRLLEINYQQLKTLQSERAGSIIRSFMKGHVVVMLLGIAWVIFLGFLVFNIRGNIYFTISAGLIILFNVFAVIAYLQHLAILGSIDIAESIIKTQQKLARVNTSYINVGRILLLQTPFYCTWWYSQELITNASPLFWVIQVAIVAALTAFAIYLFIKLSPHSSTDHWAKRTDKFFGAEKLQKAITFLNKIEEFKKENDS
ncbi:hypothetical protein C900_03007 [Fulvivirga imtechensis AK7]|uniref:Uncharacterized protein n=1 Tax=Fulvivirga imtechensis AK7 TaxID=1237149 RepID=L8JSN0_9BACT|nr:hypothetical protein [Fulvivirga imtechensis]ELR71203.1 hypothetical protein C900_03007 [Fulvivirga imtechensis AK7]